MLCGDGAIVPGCSSVSKVIWFVFDAFLTNKLVYEWLEGGLDIRCVRVCNDVEMQVTFNYLSVNMK